MKFQYLKKQYKLQNPDPYGSDDELEYEIYDIKKKKILGYHLTFNGKIDIEDVKEYLTNCL